jgi:hypothetical protein
VEHLQWQHMEPRAMTFTEKQAVDNVELAPEPPLSAADAERIAREEFKALDREAVRIVNARARAWQQLARILRDKTLNKTSAAAT